MRSRAPWILLGLLVLLGVEIWLLTVLADLIGVVGVVALLVLETAAGILVLRRAGRSGLAALREVSAQAPGSPAARRTSRGVGDALLVGAAGVLLVLPGLVGDVLALLFLFPPTRRALTALGARWARRRVERAVREGRATVLVDGRPVTPGPDARRPRHGGGGAAPADRRDDRRDDVVEGEVLPPREVSDGR
ncbi:FxsA family protein [Kineococcus gynurae]|uniref:FxsA family protein n=1 Tax=Kineococcus gynurae TaxID=452979 RepID=A0ABV5LQY8_9ACTN